MKNLSDKVIKFKLSIKDLSRQIDNWNYLGEDYYTPSQKEVLSRRHQINDFLKQESYKVIIPMKERDSSIRFLLQALRGRIPPDNIIVVNDRSSKKAVQAALSTYRGVIVIDKEEVLQVLDQNKLKEVMSTLTLPQGKGMAVLAGYLYVYINDKLQSTKNRFVFQHDAEIIDINNLTDFDYLIWTLLSARRKPFHIKIAKGGRNNEATMIARSLLLSLLHLPDFPANHLIKMRAVDLFKKLTPLKWMLTGQFLLDGPLAMNRPFASGYLEETLLSVFVGDASPSGSTLQVASPFPCLDDKNDKYKEDRMMQLISNFIFTLAYFYKPINRWRMNDIQFLNKNFMSSKVRFGFIPPGEKRVEIESSDNDLIVPSVAMMDENKIIDWNKVDYFVDKSKKSK